MQEEKKIIEAQQDQIEFLQEKLSQAQALGGAEGDQTAGESAAASGDAAATTETDAGDEGSHSEAHVIPPAPPPPPIDGIPVPPTFGIILYSLSQ